MQSIHLKWQHGKGCFCSILCFSLFSTSNLSAQQEDLALFRVTGVQGALALRHGQDSVEQGAEGFSPTRSHLTMDEQEITFLTQSYIYHPNLLNIDLGAGLIHTEKELDAGSQQYDTEDEVSSLTARLNFLEKKPYPFTLYYYRTHPTSNVSGTEQFVLDSIKYGVKASLLKPVIPLSVNMEVYRETIQGSGVTRVTDTATDHALLRANYNLDDDGYVQFSYQNNQQVSKSGVITQPIETIERESESTDLVSDVVFGERKQFRFGNLFSYTTQDFLPQQEEFRWRPFLEWEHSGTAKSYYNFDYTESEYNSVKTTSRSGSIGAHGALTKTLNLSGEIHGTSSETTGLEAQVRGGSTTATYTQPLSFGSFVFSVGAGYDLNEQDSPEGKVDQQNERHRYDGVELIQLAHPFVESVNNIAVERDGVIVFTSLVEGEDYTVSGLYNPTTETGDPVTYINVVIHDNPDDQKVLLGDTLIIDYTYTTGGTVVFSTTSNNYSTQLTLFKYYSLYASYSDMERKIEEGKSTIPITSVKQTRMGARVDHPFFYDIYRVGLEYTFEEREEEISPYVRRIADSFFQAALTNDTKLRLSLRRVQQDNQLSAQDIDLVSRGITLASRPWPRSSLRLEHRNDKETGGSSPRRIKRNLIQFQWQVRKLTLSLDGASVDEQLGVVTRRTNSFSASLIRAF